MTVESIAVIGTLGTGGRIGAALEVALFGLLPIFVAISVNPLAVDCPSEFVASALRESRAFCQQH